MIKTEKIKAIFDNITRSKKIHESVLLIENTDGNYSVNFGYGGKDINTPFFIASVTKLFVTTCILILKEQKKLFLNSLIKDFINNEKLVGLHNFKGIEYSHKLTISDLLFQTSGLPDGLEEGGIIKSITQNDNEVSFEEVLNITKNITPKFKPGKRAYYSDINFRLLCNIIENITGTPLAKVFQDFICIPLGLKNTYLPRKKDDFIPGIYYKEKSLYRQNYITSSYNYDAISTAKELMFFLKAFWNGLLFPKNNFDTLSVFRKLKITMGPIFYGGGYMQIPLNNINTLFSGKGELLGHSGSTGSFAFYYPHKDLYFIGDVNQMANPELPIRLVMKLAMSV